MFKLASACISGLAIASSAAAEPTQIVVRVISQDGKFVGDHTGGASVTLRDAKTGKVLALGSTKGGTGNTDRIMAAVTALVEEVRGERAPLERFNPRAAGVKEFGNPNEGGRRGKAS